MNKNTHYSLLPQENSFVLKTISEVPGTGRAINFLEQSVALLANQKIKISADELRKLKEATTQIKSRCELRSPRLFRLISFIPFTKANKIKKLASKILAFSEKEILEKKADSTETTSPNREVPLNGLPQISPERQKLIQENKEKKEKAFQSVLSMRNQADEKLIPLVNFRSSSSKTTQYFYNNEAIRGLYEKLGESSPLKKQLVDYVSNNYADLNEENTDLPLIASPTHLSLVNQTNYYQQKYGIKMLVCLCSDLASTIQNLKAKNEQDPVGIIVVSSDCQEGHVTPIIVDLQDKDNQMITLDILGPLAELWKVGTFTQTTSIAEKLKLKMISSNNHRQVDQYSCRTDALVTLRNSLLWIKNKKAEQAYTGLSNLLIGPAKNLHPECDYTNQVTNPYLKQEGKENFLVIKDKLKGNQNTFVRQAIEHRMENSQTTTFKYQLVLDKRIVSNLLKINEVVPELRENEFQKKWEEIIQASDLENKGVEVSIKDDSNIEIKWKTEKKINTYTVKKGFRNLERQIKSEKL